MYDTRSEKVHQAILVAALEEVFAVGFRALSIDAIAAKAGVGKTTIYRRWPNKAAVVMDAFLGHVGAGTDFPRTARAIESIRTQMLAQTKAFRGKYGSLVKPLLGEAQCDPELAEAFRERWTLPRRRLASQVIEEAIQQGDLRADINIETAIDALYAPIYYRLQKVTGPISEAYVDGIFAHAIDGLSAGNLHATFRGSRGAGDRPPATRWATSDGRPYRDSNRPISVGRRSRNKATEARLLRSSEVASQHGDSLQLRVRDSFGRSNGNRSLICWKWFQQICPCQLRLLRILRQ